jgi:hypothetical protein
MQSDGNLVIYPNGNPAQPALWASGTSGHSGAYLALQNDANVVIYAGGGAIWVKFYIHHVYGTCADGACGLNERSGPGYSNYSKTGSFYDGQEVDVVCQTAGQTVSNGSQSTNVWDRLTNGGYVTDMYVDTANSRHGFSPPIPQC